MSALDRIIIESPLAGDFQRNYRFVLWCCRAVWEREGLYALASHMINPWYMDDTVAVERDAGINNPWVWSSGFPHWFFLDLGLSTGMRLGKERCQREGIHHIEVRLSEYAPEAWGAFETGEWPPCTPGFKLGGQALPGVTET